MTKASSVSFGLAYLLWCSCSAGTTPPGKKPSDGGIDPDAATKVTASTDGDAFLADYASQVCAMYEPCCNSAKLGYDASGCATWFRKVTAAYFRGEYSEDGARSCLAKLAQVRDADKQRCANVLDFDLATLRSECQKAFGATAREGAAPGEKCLLAADCARPSDADVICSSGKCLLQRVGKAGDGPCFQTRSADAGVSWETVTCATSDGLYCDREKNGCVAQVADAESCVTGTSCKPTARCIGGRCEPLPGPGEACLNGIQGAGGFCQPGSACDRSTLICGSPLPEGASCRESAECASGACMAGKCTKPEFTRALNCTG